MNRKSFDFDVLTGILYALLALFGWLTIYAVSSTGEVSDLPWYATIHGKQLIWIALSIVAAWVVLMLDLRFIVAISYLAYGLSLGLLVAVIFLGKEVNGAKAWIEIGGQSFQPAELAKLTTAMALARYMSALNFSMNNIRHLLVAMGIVLLPALIVIFQNDTGSALVFGSFMIVFYREGLNPLLPIGLVLLAIIAILTLWLENPLYVSYGLVVLAAISMAISFNRRNWGRIVTLHLIAVLLLSGYAYSMNAIVEELPSHQQIRIKVLFNPNLDPQGAGYNVIHSKIAIGSGGITGKGFLEGHYTKYRFVPKQETDFIYCTVGEEQGWLGTSFVLALFFLLIWRIKFLAENSKTRYARIYGYSLLSIIFFHVIVNIGMTIGLVPVIGIPLPFFSYGGSSFLTFSVLIFIMVNLYSYRASVLGSKI